MIGVETRMLDRMSGTFLEPDGTEGTYQLKHYIDPEGEIILGYTFSCATVHKGVAVNPDQVISFGDLDVYPKDALKEAVPEDVAQVVPPTTWKRPPGYELQLAARDHYKHSLLLRELVRRDEGPALDNEDEIDRELHAALGTVPRVWLNDVESRFDSEDDMLESFQTPDNLKNVKPEPHPLSARVPYTKEAVAVERGFYASFEMYEGWANALKNACLNQGVSEGVAVLVARNFLDDSFGVVMTDLDEPEFPDLPILEDVDDDGEEPLDSSAE